MTRRKKIFVIEDNKGLLNIILDILKEKGYDVRGCSSSEEALMILPNFLPDLFILDLKLQKRTAISMFEEIIKYGSSDNVPVIVISAYIRLNKIKKFFDKYKRKIFFVEKPFKIEELIDMIRDTV